MAESGGGAAFPVVFFDGKRESNVGNVRIHQSTEFKTFRSILRQKIGISSNKFTIYLVDRKKSKFSPDDGRKILISGKVSFSVIAREKNCYFLVILKSAKRDRRRRPRLSNVDFGNFLPEERLSQAQSKLPKPETSSENMILLRRNQPVLESPLHSVEVPAHYNEIAPSEFEIFNERLEKLQIHREIYMRMISNSDLNLDLDLHLDLDSSNSRTFCEECTEVKKGKPASFHCCIYDAVTVGFRSPVGPITPPYKVFR